MSEPKPDPVNPPNPDPHPDPQQARWVKAKVVGEDTEPPAEPLSSEDATAPVPVPDQPPVTSAEMEGARWFFIAFLIVIVPLGLIVLGLIVWGVVRSLDW